MGSSGSTSTEMVHVLSKMRIVDRFRRIVEYTDLEVGVCRVHLKMIPRCNAGDVQKMFNLQISQHNYKGALTILESRSAKQEWM